MAATTNGHENGHENGHTNGHENGHENGHANGHENGHAVPHHDSKYAAVSLIFKFSVSMALQAALKLGIPDILATAKDGRLSASEILAKLPTKSTPGPLSIVNLRRLLSPLVREGVFTLSTNANNEPVYGLTEVSKFFVKSDEANMLSIAALNWNPASLASWHNAHEVILDEKISPFEKTHGLPSYEYMKKDPELRKHFLGSMETYGNLEMKQLLESIQLSGVIDGVNTLVDVGGNHGNIIGAIVSQHPRIKGINFDLPYVVASAPPIKGVEHVGGSFLESVPSGDAMILKFVIHNNGDEASIKALQNCYKALPKNGKVILVEYCIQNENLHNTRGEFVAVQDLIMLLVMTEGRERTKEEYLEILKAAGFARPSVIHNPGSLDLIVGYKE